MSGLFQRYVLHNLGLKILSLMLATGLWFLISPDEQPAEVAVRSPIEFQHVPAYLEISSEVIPEAQIRVRGPERVIRQLRSTDLHAEIELANAKPGERTYDLTSQQVRRPRDLTVVQVVPSQVHLEFDTRASKDVEIRPNVIGAANAKVEFEPKTITITGPKHHVDLVTSATTDPVDAGATRGSATFTTNVYVADPLVQVIQPTTIRVTVTMEKAADH